MTINNKYNIGQIVYLLTDREQCERIITCIQIVSMNNISYQLSCGIAASWHYDYEIISNKDLVKALQ